METQLAKKKLRGAFYTPKIIADFLCKWAIKSPSDSLLEPCFGDGEFLFSTIEVMQSLGASKFQIAQCITGIELDLKENAKVKNLLRESAFEMPSGAILQGDFFSHYHRSLKNNRYDVVIGNPPFLRYQNFPEDQREKAFRIIEEAGLKPNRLTNAWVPFVLAASLLLKEEGRLAMVVPAELLQVNYASQLRHFLNEYFSELTVITFKKIVFPDIQQEVVLLLAKKGQKRHGINVVELKNGECLVDYEHELPQINELKPINHSSDKWTQYYLTTKEILLLRNLQHRLADQTLGAIAEVDVGIVTGRNEFFVTDSAVRKTYNLATYSLPLVGRTSQIRGLIFTKEDWLLCEKGGQKTYLLNFPQLPISKLPKLAQKYIQIGEKVGYHEGYKCRIRNPWYCVPSQWVSDALLFRQIYDAPRLVLNNAESYTTDTIHRVRFKTKVEAQKITALFHNSLTFAFTEIMGRSYGGGVLELEPNEAEKLPLPLINVPKNFLKELDKEFRKAKDIDAVLQKTDDLLLRKAMRLSVNEIQMLRAIWKKLSSRRIERKFN